MTRGRARLRGDRVQVATYNVHGCVGTDGMHDPERVALVIRQTEASVVGLQEVDCRTPLPDGRDQLHRLAEATGMTAVAGYTRRVGDGYFGNALLTRHEVIDVDRRDLSVPGREPRGVLVARLRVGGEVLEVAVTHFGLGGAERRRQVATLLDLVTLGDEPVVLLGDFNEWWPRAVTLAELHGVFGYAPPARSFPSRAPIFALDRIWAHPRECLSHVRAVRTASARRASDHLPVTARLRLPGAGG